MPDREASVSPSIVGATRTVALQYVARACALVFAALVTALLTRRLGSEFVDWATVINAVALTGVILEPGLTPPIVRRLSQDPAAAPGVNEMVVVRLVLGALALAVVVVVALATRGPDIWLLALLLGGQVLARAIVLNATPWLQVDQRLHRAAFFELGTAALGVCAVAVGIRLEAPTPILGLLAFTAPMILLAVVIQFELGRTSSARIRPSAGAQRPAVLSVIREAAPLAGAIALTAVYTRSSIAFVNAYEGDAEASRFFFAFFFAEQCIIGAGILAGAVLPLMAYRASVTDLRTDRVTHDLLVATTAVGGVAGGVLIATGTLITRALGGPALSGAEHYIWLLSPLAATVFMSMTVAYVLISIGLGHRYVFFAALGVVANLALNALFTPEFGAHASTRITWATELAAALLPLVTLLAVSPAGRRTLLRLGIVVGLAIVTSELTQSGALPPLASGSLMAGAALLLGARSASRLRHATGSPGVALGRPSES
jgi:O-antigen/teichoic acid export membrane protein